ncbi:hypothetical protein B0H11DRAFT_2286546 [Mycena galericulata]|nr:hypothetical protein B0H11DRAFT_1817783 [Mycena galericulata]KAJ7458767.1 hypothetical protein B0H11DRAFT_2286546 [Mycena galericulata]
MSIETSTIDQSYQVVENTGQFEKHPKYWYKDGSMVFRVDNVLYKVHASMFEQLSGMMQSILSIPDGKPADDPTREGTEKYPLLLPGITGLEFNDFLLWLYRIGWEPMADPEERERIFTHLLKLSDLWEIKAGKAHAIENLETLVLPPSRRLELAGKFAIPSWVEPAVRDILNQKLTNLTDTDICAMGWKVYSMLVNAKEMLETETRRTALVAPLMEKDPSWECKNHSSCLSVWPKVWFERIGKKLLHTITPLKLSEIRAEVGKEDTLRHPGLADACQADMVWQIVTVIVFADQQIIPACAAAIVKYHESL